MPRAFHRVAVAVRATATVALYYRRVISEFGTRSIYAALRHARVVDCGVASDAGA